jgi:hypothetical protein
MPIPVMTTRRLLKNLSDWMSAEPPMGMGKRRGVIRRAFYD